MLSRVLACRTQNGNHAAAAKCARGMRACVFVCLRMRTSVRFELRKRRPPHFPAESVFCFGVARARWCVLSFVLLLPIRRSTGVCRVASIVRRRCGTNH